jgi:glycosyltransferase involved in cell wall biosynthesis
MLNPRLRIALVITELEPGGAERCLTNVAVGLDRGRFEVVVYALAPRPRPRRDELVCRLEQAGVPVHFLGFTRAPALPRAVHTLARHWRRYRPDVIHSMLFHANVVAGMARGRWGPGALILGIRVADPSRWRRWLERRIARRADRVACVSQQVADFATRRMRLPPRKLVVIPNGVDLASSAHRNPASCESLGIPPGRRILACVSRLAVQKGLDQLIRVAPSLLEALPDHDLVVVGEGPQERQLRTLADHSPVAGRVHLIGWRSDICEILLASDVLILPSRWEGMPNVLLEAMACRRPVVCTRAEGVVEVLGPGAEQQTVAVESPQDIVEKAVTIIRQPALAHRLGAENRQRVERHFGLAAMIDRYASLFQSVFRVA